MKLRVPAAAMVILASSTAHNRPDNVAPAAKCAPAAASRGTAATPVSVPAVAQRNAIPVKSVPVLLLDANAMQPVVRAAALRRKEELVCLETRRLLVGRRATYATLAALWATNALLPVSAHAVAQASVLTVKSATGPIHAACATARAAHLVAAPRR